MSRNLRSHRLVQGAILLAALSLIPLTWTGTFNAMYAERREALAAVEANASNHALAFEGELHRQLLAIEQTLRILEHDWEKDPAHFDIRAWSSRAVVLGDVSLHLYVADAEGIIRASTRPELVGANVSGRNYFSHEASLPVDDGQMFIGPSTPGLVTKRWQMNMVRRLDHPDGSFAGVIGLSYDTALLERFYKRADLGTGGMVALVGGRGMLRALVGPTSAEPGLDIARSPMFAAMSVVPEGRWTGPSAPDGVVRIHAFRRVPGRDMIVVVGYDRARALLPSDAWQRGAVIFGVGITLFVLVLAGGLVRELRVYRLSEERLARDRSVLEAAYAQLEAAKSRADAKTAQLEVTLAGMSDGVSMLDADLRLLQWNSRFSEFTGVPPEMLRVGLPMADILAAQARAGEFGEVDVETEVERRLTLLRAMSQVCTVERKRPDGSTLELRRSPLRGGGFVTLYSDITAHKQAEESQRRAREQAEAAAEEKSRLVAIVSHEIRTPLNTLLNSLGMLAESGISPSDRRLVAMGRQAGEALLGLINDILEMSKIEAGRLGLHPSLFDPRLLMVGVIEMFRVPATGRGITLRLKVADAVPDRVQADPARLRQVLMNLLSNATKFAMPGEVLLSADADLEGERAVLRLAVTDQGPAIADADRDRLFQPFSRLGDTGGEGKPGSGLGLAICRHLIELMGGRIGHETMPHGGNTFWVTLSVPIAQSRGHADGAREAPPVCVLPRTRILLVEDVPANQLITATLLRRAGHLVDVAGSGEEAVQRVERQPYDVVFMDIFMPGMSGLEATRRIRALPGPAGAVPILALTANVSHEDRARCKAAGMQDMLGKPTDPAELIDALGRHVWSAGAPAAPTEPASQPRAECEPAEPEPAEREPAEREPLLSEARLADLRDNMPPGVLGSLVDACLTDLHEHMPALRQALTSADASAIEQEAHAMAGVAGGYGMAALESRLRAVLTAARLGDARDAAAKAGDLERELERAGAALREALRPETV
jgi:signal transduction histidine kinase/CheY-like chemotaxis protein